MNNHSPSNFIADSGLALAMAMTLAVGTSVLAQSPAPAGGSLMIAGTKAERRQGMQQQREQMMAEMKAQDAELTVLLAKVSAAPEKQKADLLVTVVTRMVAQRTAMHARMDAMMQRMMDDMPMNHDSMASHPMMQGKAGKSADTAKKQP